MYHCVPSSISPIAAISTPPRIRIRNSKITGNNAVAGTEAASWTSGCIIRANRGLNPIATPTGTVHNAPIINARFTRKNVIPALRKSCMYSESGNRANSPTAR